ncbi:hypothetical protein BJ085DRAFT_36314 [Dimargaris cristalligena]|uniref:Uncharacterized protein n=1 Tax=Dimargaris cristalligena TaxID=215637 RepID=A0A4P9ZR20_9FUNG|nr:hypothetical protein BJ085DRAFT_36314 [Dimargaris cristalligena]|eukprot:RKP35092.1 hypothetical protein BJ085DRAFT_36314 [Dimargaris cristalligena]
MANTTYAGPVFTPSSLAQMDDISHRSFPALPGHTHQPLYKPGPVSTLDPLQGMVSFVTYHKQAYSYDNIGNNDDDDTDSEAEFGDNESEGDSGVEDSSDDTSTSDGSDQDEADGNDHGHDHDQGESPHHQGPPNCPPLSTDDVTHYFESNLPASIVPSAGSKQLPTDQYYLRNRRWNLVRNVDSALLNQFELWVVYRESVPALARFHAEPLAIYQYSVTSLLEMLPEDRQIMLLQINPHLATNRCIRGILMSEFA